MTPTFDELREQVTPCTACGRVVQGSQTNPPCREPATCRYRIGEIDKWRGVRAQPDSHEGGME